MFRTVTVHPQEILFRCCICRLWYVVRNALCDTSRWYNVWGRINNQCCNIVYLFGMYIYCKKWYTDLPMSSELMYYCFHRQAILSVYNNVKFVRHKLKRSHLAMFVNENCRSRKCIFASSTALLSPTADLPTGRKMTIFSADTIVIFFYIQWTISIIIRLGNFFRWFTKQESLHRFLRRCKFNVFKSLQFNEG